MNALASISPEIDYLNYHFDRTDRFYQLQIKINLLASVVFGLSSFVFEHFKNYNAERWTFGIGVAFLAITTTISLIYTYSIFRDKSKEYDTAKTKAISLMDAQKSLVEAEKRRLDKEMEVLQKRIDNPTAQEREIKEPKEDDENNKVKGKKEGKGKKGKHTKAKSPITTANTDPNISSGGGSAGSGSV